MTADTPTLNLARAQAVIGTDEDGRSTLVITDGDTEIVLAAGEDRRANIRGSARLKRALYDYEELLIGQPQVEPVNASRRHR